MKLGDSRPCSTMPSGEKPSGDVGPARFREVMGHFATGVTVVTGIDPSGPAGFTCQAFAPLSLDPPLVAVAPAKTSMSWPRIASVGVFCVNVLSEAQEELCRRFAVSGGDKFMGVRWRHTPKGAPLIEGALAWAECALVRVHDAGDHELVIGRVLGLGTGDGGGGGAGAARPLLFYRGRFGLGG